MFYDLIVGGISGVISRTLTAPLELYKIQEQNKYMPNSTIRATIRKEGIIGLWKGNYVNCLRIFPQMAINFSVYKFSINNICIYLPDKYCYMKTFIGGAIAGIISMTVIYPLENIRSRLSLQTKRSHYSGIYDVFKKTPTRELYNGLKMSLLGFGPYTALNYMFYNSFKQMTHEHFGLSGQIANLVCGGLAGLSAVTFTYPTDLIRRRLQLQGFDTSVPKYNGIIDCVTKIYRTNGIGELYRGLIPCYIKIFPAVALQFWTMETLKGL